MVWETTKVYACDKACLQTAFALSIVMEVSLRSQITISQKPDNTVDSG